MKIFQSNLLSQSSVFISRIILQLVFPPLMLFFWGINNFNLWIFIFSVPSLMSIFQIAASDPARNEMYKLFKEEKFNEVNKVYQNSFFILLINIIWVSKKVTIQFFRK